LLFLAGSNLVQTLHLNFKITDQKVSSSYGFARMAHCLWNFDVGSNLAGAARCLFSGLFGADGIAQQVQRKYGGADSGFSSRGQLVFAWEGF
jgi:hypothetical protein